MASPLSGLDSLLAMVQMPAGVPVAVFGIGESGAVNAALFAAEMLAGGDPGLRERLQAHRAGQRAGVLARSRKLKEKLGGG
jgi:phosphoribosylaminoimidazole carboxylase PurE protein